MHIKKMQGRIEIIPVLRTAEELFFDTVKRDFKSKGFSFIINANFYDLTDAGKIDVFMGHDPVAAAETTPEGYVVSNGRVVAGTAEPLNFYLAYDKTKLSAGIGAAYSCGQGNPPVSSTSAFGGLGPLIINGLQYNESNEYSEGVPVGAPFYGDPGPKFRAFLVKRSNKKFAAFMARDIATGLKLGKTCVGFSKDKIIAVVQQDGESGGSLISVRNYFLSEGCNNAVFFDGSDSSLLYDGSVVVYQGENKDETCTVGIGFRVEKK